MGIASAFGAQFAVVSFEHGYRGTVPKIGGIVPSIITFAWPMTIGAAMHPPLAFVAQKAVPALANHATSLLQPTVGSPLPGGQHVTLTMPFSTTSTTALSVLADRTHAAVDFFNSVRTPSALIAGSSLAALFSLMEFMKAENLKKASKLERLLLLVYHLFTLASFGLSVIVLVSTTATGNAILFDNLCNPMASSTFEFLTREYPFDFMLTRFSFYTSLLSFLGSVVIRTLLQFQLLRKDRRRSAILVGCSLGSVFFHLLSFVNDHLINTANLFTMAIAITKMFIADALKGHKICQMISAACLVGAMGAAVALAINPTLKEEKDALPAP